ncbi:MAG: hypothetical protein WD423_09890 [Rhodothermales bacterium]
MLACTALWWSVVGSTPASGQAMEGAPERLAIFLDCGWCNQTFIRQEMTYVDYVRDREGADVHVLVTDVNTAAGGEAFTFDLIGRGVFQGMDHTAQFTSEAGATQDQERRGFLRTLQVALAPYLIHTSVGPRLALQVGDGNGSVDTQPADDPWNNWTFEVYGDAWANFESSQQSLRARYGLSAERVTEEWKIRLRPFFNYNFDEFERNDETITSTSRRDGFDAYVVKSLGPHWSAGLFGDVYTSTFSNIDLRYRGMPAVEYSVFPYREATRRQLTFTYRVGGIHVTYADTTIFNEISEVLPEHAFNAAYEVTQPWGEIDIGVEVSQYLHDTSKYSAEFGGDVEVRITRGLSVEFGGDVEWIKNQLNLPKGDASLDEVLLRRRQLATNYELSFQFGFNYRFGSIYNNVVNTRF